MLMSIPPPVLDPTVVEMLVFGHEPATGDTARGGGQAVCQGWSIASREKLQGQPQIPLCNSKQFSRSHTPSYLISWKGQPSKMGERLGGVRWTMMLIPWLLPVFRWLRKANGRLEGGSPFSTIIDLCYLFFIQYSFQVVQLSHSKTKCSDGCCGGCRDESSGLYPAPHLWPQNPLRQRMEKRSANNKGSRFLLEEKWHSKKIGNNDKGPLPAKFFF